MKIFRNALDALHTYLKHSQFIAIYDILGHTTYLEHLSMSNGMGYTILYHIFVTPSGVSQYISLCITYLEHFLDVMTCCKLSHITYLENLLIYCGLCRHCIASHILEHLSCFIICSKSYYIIKTYLDLLQYVMYWGISHT